MSHPRDFADTKRISLTKRLPFDDPALDPTVTVTTAEECKKGPRFAVDG
jgi:hypothetical protein